MANETNQAYLQYIKKAIEDFDKIYGKLVDKGVAVYPEELTDGYYETGVATSEYAGLISNLYAIKNGDEFVTPSSTTVSQLNTITPTGATVDTQTGVISFSGLGEGFITSNTTASTTLATEAATIGNFKLVSGEETSSYVYTPDKIVKNVTIQKGSVSINAENIEYTKSVPTGVITTATAVSEDIASGVIGTQFDTGVAGYTSDKYVTLNITPTLNLDCEHTLSLSKGKGFDFTAGYIADVTLQDVERVITETNTVDDQDFTIYLKKATLSNVTSSGTIGFGDSDIGTSTKTAGTEYYTIKADAALNVSGSISAGYIDSGTKLESSNSSGDKIDAEFFVKKSALVDVNLTSTEYKVDITGASIGSVQAGALSEEDYYNIKVELPSISKTIIADEGYIKANADKDNEFAITGTGTTQHISIAKGELNAVSSAALAGIGDVTGFTKSAPSSENLSKYTAIPLTLSSTNIINTGDFTEGYITSGDYTLSSSSADEATIYVQNQTTTKNTVGLSVVAVDAGKETAISIFETEAPSGNKTGDDYYKITANSLVTLTAGYAADGRDETASEAYYLPKASLKYIEDSEKGNILEVTSGGYLPAGLLTSIADITGTIDVAEVHVGLTGKLENGKYVVTASCDTTKTNVGYFDTSESFVSNTFTIDAGSVKTDASIIGSTFKSVTKKDENKYTVTATTSGKVNTDVTPGYILASDLTVNDASSKDGVDVTFSADTTVELDKAIISVDSSDSTVSVKATPTGFAFAEAADASSYKITVDLGDDKTIKAKASSGYIATEDSSTSLTVTTTTVDYTLKAATVGAVTAVTGANQVTIQSDINDNVTGNYTIKLADNSTVSAKADIEEGYTGKTTATGSVAVTANTITIAHGSVTGTVESKSNVISSGTTGLNVYTKQEDVAAVSAKSFKINATDSITASASVTAGYVKSSDVSASDIVTSTGSAWLAGYEGQVDTETGDYIINNGFVVTTGEHAGEAIDSETIQTAGKYLDKNITVKLHDDAMGANVRAELALLEHRLAGGYVSKVGGAQA